MGNFNPSTSNTPDDLIKIDDNFDAKLQSQFDAIKELEKNCNGAHSTESQSIMNNSTNPFDQDDHINDNYQKQKSTNNEHNDNMVTPLNSLFVALEPPPQKKEVKSFVIDAPDKEKSKNIPNISEEKYVHQVIEQDINCPHILKSFSRKTTSCSIYYAMIKKKKYNKHNLNHLYEFRHFKNEYEHKPKCKHGDECVSYIKSEEGKDDITDQCHMKLYLHPPRTRQIKLAENIHSMIFNKTWQENHEIYQPTDEDLWMYSIEVRNDGILPKDGYLPALFDEVIFNGYKYDLCLQCHKGDHCEHDVYNSECSILHIVNDKMKCERHKLMGMPLKHRRDLMLSLVLYTGCDCNYDLCASQRSGDYNKWKYFDYCLWLAIKKLSNNETGSFAVFSGLNGVKMNRKRVKGGCFVTYVSTSWRKEVSEAFMKGEGMIMEFDEYFQRDSLGACCDVSWISKFPDECEVLFARSQYVLNEFEYKVVDDANGIQTVKLNSTNVNQWLDEQDIGLDKIYDISANVNDY